MGYLCSSLMIQCQCEIYEYTDLIGVPISCFSTTTILQKSYLSITIIDISISMNSLDYGITMISSLNQAGRGSSCSGRFSTYILYGQLQDTTNTNLGNGYPYIDAIPVMVGFMSLFITSYWGNENTSIQYEGTELPFISSETQMGDVKWHCDGPMHTSPYLCQ